MRYRPLPVTGLLSVRRARHDPRRADQVRRRARGLPLPADAVAERAEPGRNDDVYRREEPREDWPQSIPHVDQPGEERGIPFFRQL